MNRRERDELDATFSQAAADINRVGLLTPEAAAVLEEFHRSEQARRDAAEALLLAEAGSAHYSAFDRRMAEAAKVRRREELREQLRRLNVPPPGPTRAEKAKAEKAAKRARAKVRKAAHQATRAARLRAAERKP